MKLATSTGDFGFYIDALDEMVKAFKGGKFKYINLELPTKMSELFDESEDGWKRVADKLGDAAAYAGVEYVVSHSPCLNVFGELCEERYNRDVRALRRSLEICNVLGIKRIVIHVSNNWDFSEKEFYDENKRCYGDLSDLMEKYGITVMAENVDYLGSHVGTGMELREFVEYMDHPLLCACWDTAHGNINEEARAIGQYQNIVALGDKLKGLHVSDNFGDCHHHSWPFAGIINFDSVMQALLDVKYDGFFTFEASYTLLHQKNPPYNREVWEHNGETVTKLLSPSTELKKMAVELLYETGKHILTTYNCYEG